MFYSGVIHVTRAETGCVHQRFSDHTSTCSPSSPVPPPQLNSASSARRVDDQQHGAEVAPEPAKKDDAGALDSNHGCRTKPLHLRVTAKGSFLDGLPVFAGDPRTEAMLRQLFEYFGPSKVCPSALLSAADANARGGGARSRAEQAGSWWGGWRTSDVGRRGWGTLEGEG